LTAAGKLELARRVTKEALLESKLEQIRRLQAEVDQLRATTATDQTVTLHVKIMELQVTKMRELGFDFHTAEGIGFEQITGDTLVDLGALNGLIEALRKHDLVKVLAEPTLVTVSGRPATFQSGGEFPIVVPQNLGNQAVEYRQFGTRLDCVAEVLDSGRIRLELRPTVSEIDTSRSVMIQQMSVPGLRTRCVDTAVEMEAGETLVLSGMRQTRAKRAGDSDGIEETALLVSVTANLGGPFMQTGKKVASKRR
jgi:pilus assembly protein CpaC